jgi:hypothetical protein
MKKIFLIVLLLAGMAGAVSAQVEGKALGVRFGNAGEISYQHPLSGATRLEFDLGFGSWKHGGMYLTGIHHWVKDLSELQEGFNWYYGIGGAAGINTNLLSAAVVGNIGIEYNFDFPLQLSLDWRPGLYVVPAVVLGWDGVALSARWRF